MRTWKILLHLLLTLLLSIGASSAISAKVASGDQNLTWTEHQAENVFNWLTCQGKSDRSTTGPPECSVVPKSAGKASDNVIHVTKDGVALPPGPKHKIPDNYVQNPHRSGNYGEIVNGKYKERLRIDPPTPPGQKGPNYSHYHKNGKGTHYSPRPGDSDTGF
jgi:hypothetical protein